MAEKVPLPPYQEIDFQAIPSLRNAHVIAQKMSDAVLLNYQEVLHGWFHLFLVSQIKRRGEARSQLRRTLVRGKNRSQSAEFTFGINNSSLPRTPVNAS